MVDEKLIAMLREAETIMEEFRSRTAADPDMTERKRVGIALFHLRGSRMGLERKNAADVL